MICHEPWVEERWESTVVATMRRSEKAGGVHKGGNVMIERRV